MKRKIILAGIMGILLVITGFQATIANELPEKDANHPSRDGSTLYVGGSGPGNYSTIQGAINEASHGDTVYAYDDSSPYIEEIVIDKSILLQGENTDTTLIDGNDENENDLIRITADDVTITGFTILNSRWYPKLLRITSENNIITQNYLGPSGGSIFIENSSSNRFIENRITDVMFNLESDYNEVVNNEFIANVYGALTIRGSHNLIANNVIYDVEGSYGSIYFNAIEVQGSVNIIVENKIQCDAQENYNGITLLGTDNTVQQNELVSCGITFYGVHNENILEDNSINGKALVIIVDESDMIINDVGQVYIFRSSDITVQDCDFTGVFYGIRCEDSTNVVFIHNVVQDCYSGIEIRGCINAEISYNQICLSRYGIVSFISPGTIISTNIVENTLSLGQAITISGSRNILEKNIIRDNVIGLAISGLGHKIQSNEFANNSMAIDLGFALGNQFTKNNFFDSDIHASFQFSCFNFWCRNYWDRARFLPKIIPGILFSWSNYPHGREIIIPWINIDFLPAKIPYDIP